MKCDCCGKIIEPGLAFPQGEGNGCWCCSECDEWKRGQYQGADWMIWIPILMLVGVGAICWLVKEVFIG